MMPSASIILPVRDAEETIFDSVCSILSQSVTDIEIIVLDNGSTDKSMDIIEAFRDPRIKVINTAGMTLADSLNLGVNYSSGEICIRMDADDISYPTRFARLCEEHERSNNCLVIGSDCNYIIDGHIDKTVSKMPNDSVAIRWHCLFNSPFIHPAVSFKRLPFIHMGYKYPGAYLHCEDYALWSRLVFHNDCFNIPSPLLAYRISLDNQSNPVKRQKQLLNHDKTMHYVLNVILGTRISARDVHNLRVLAVTAEYSQLRAGDHDSAVIKAINNLGDICGAFLAIYGRNDDVVRSCDSMISSVKRQLPGPEGSIKVV